MAKKNKQVFLRPLIWKTDEACRFLFFISQKTGHFFKKKIISLKTNEAPLLGVHFMCKNVDILN